MQKASFNGKTYMHPMIAETQRRVTVAITALRMMQEHHGNPYFCFKCVPIAEEKEWRAKAEEITPPVIIEPEPELAAAYDRIAELEKTLAHVRDEIEICAPALPGGTFDDVLGEINTALSGMVAQ